MNRIAAIAVIAAICHDANRRLCVEQGDNSQPTWEDAPDWQKDSAIAGVEAIADQRTTRPEQSHESWLAQKVADGWKYGAVKDPVKKEHPCFVPYEELPHEQKHKDHLFFSIASTMLERFGHLGVAAGA